MTDIEKSNSDRLFAKAQDKKLDNQTRYLLMVLAAGPETQRLGLEQLTTLLWAKEEKVS